MLNNEGGLLVAVRALDSLEAVRIPSMTVPFSAISPVQGGPRKGTCPPGWAEIHMQVPSLCVSYFFLGRGWWRAWARIFSISVANK